MYQGGGPRPPRGMPPPIIIHDMQALERRREQNLREARERVRRRLQEEARQKERRFDPHPQRQSVHKDDQVPSVGVEVFHEQQRNNWPHDKSHCHPQENNILAQRISDHHQGKVAALKSRFETPQKGQSQNKKKRPEGIYAQIDETKMMDFKPLKQQEEKVIKTVVHV